MTMTGPPSPPPAPPTSPRARQIQILAALVRSAAKIVAELAPESGLRALQARTQIEIAVDAMSKAVGFLEMPASSVRIDPRREG